MNFRRPALSVLAFLLLGASFHGVAAQEEVAEVEAPRAMIEKMHAAMDKLLEKAKPGSMPVVHKIVEKNLEKTFDLETFASLAFKRYFKKLKPKDRKAYIRSFQGLIEATYTKRLKPGVSHWMKHRGEKIIENRSKVSITVGNDESEFDVDYLMELDSNLGWRIYDIWIDDVSMARNYRSQFYKIYKANGLRGPKGLIEHMDRRRKEQHKEGLR